MGRKTIFWARENSLSCQIHIFHYGGSKNKNVALEIWTWILKVNFEPPQPLIQPVILCSRSSKNLYIYKTNLKLPYIKGVIFCWGFRVNPLDPPLTGMFLLAWTLGKKENFTSRNNGIKFNKILWRGFLRMQHWEV